MIAVISELRNRVTTCYFASQDSADNFIARLNNKGGIVLNMEHVSIDDMIAKEKGEK